MTNTDANNSAKDPSSSNTVILEKAKLRDSLLRLILHRNNDNANNSNRVVLLGDGSGGGVVEDSLLLPALLQNTCISSSLYGRITESA